MMICNRFQLQVVKSSVLCGAVVCTQSAVQAKDGTRKDSQ
jgi:hypothetical protein